MPPSPTWTRSTRICGDEGASRYQPLRRFLCGRVRSVEDLVRANACSSHSSRSRNFAPVSAAARREAQRSRARPLPGQATRVVLFPDEQTTHIYAGSTPNFGRRQPIPQDLWVPPWVQHVLCYARVTRISTPPATRPLLIRRHPLRNARIQDSAGPPKSLECERPRSRRFGIRLADGMREASIHGMNRSASSGGAS